MTRSRCLYQKQISSFEFEVFIGVATDAHSFTSDGDDACFMAIEKVCLLESFVLQRRARRYYQFKKNAMSSFLSKSLEHTVH